MEAHTHILPVDEGERQAVLMALAHLACERPGWDWMLSEIAKRVDNVEDDRPALFDRFKEIRQRLHTDVVAP